MGCAVTKPDEPDMSSTKTDTDFKARLEHKLYLARENPEPIFDLSECNLKIVPQGIFSLCKVFRKDVLLLYNNLLTSLEGGGSLNDLKLLTILDLHRNCFVHLNPAINSLTNLRELYLNDNQLKYLPDSICDLFELEILNIDNNKLRSLPENMGKLNSLQKLYFKGNERISEIPFTILKCRNLQEIHLDVENIREPPSDITTNGVRAILKYFAEKHDTTYENLDEIDNKQMHSVNNSSYNRNENRLEQKLAQLENIKKQRHAEYLALERQNEISYRQELELQDAEKIKKDKFLKDLLEQQIKLESEVLRFQKTKDEDRKKLIDHIIQVERKADGLVNQLISLKNDPVYIKQNLEQERLEEERLLRLFRKEYDVLRKKDVLSAMEGLLRDENVQLELLRDYEINRTMVTNSVLEQEQQSADSLTQILLIRDSNHKHDLVQNLQRDEKLQRVAVGALLERGDSRSWQLVQQVRLVERELGELTGLEIEKRRVQNDAQVNEIAEMRCNLSMLLVDLLGQQNQRRNQLLETLKKLEDEQKTSSEDFWLLQYQRLMDSQPENLKNLNVNLDPVLTSYLLSEGVLHCLPFLAKWILDTSDPDNLLRITDSVLLNEAGVKNKSDRDSIIRAINLYSEEIRCAQKKLDMDHGENLIILPGPSAPVLTPSCSDFEIGNDKNLEIGENFNSQEDTRLSRLQTPECVICMDNECQMIFIPCGHMCCCTDCSRNEDLKICPMCRAEIAQKIRVVLP